MCSLTARCAALRSSALLSLPELSLPNSRSCSTKQDAPTHPSTVLVASRSSGGNVGLVLATLHRDKVGRVVGLGAMAGSSNTGAAVVGQERGGNAGFAPIRGEAGSR